MRGGLSSVAAGLSLGIVVYVTAISLFTTRYGWQHYFEIFSHFQLQYWLICLILTGGLYLLKRRRLLLIALCCCALVSGQILPWYWPPSFLFSPNAAANLRVLIANLNTQNTQYDKILALTRAERPDLAVFVEVNQTWVEQLDTLSDSLPYSSGQANPDNLGIMLYSQQPLIDPEITFFSSDHHASVVSQVSFNDQLLSVVATHPPPPVRQSLFHARNRQLDQIGQYLQAANDPVLFLGDLNTTMWSPYYQRLVRQTGLYSARKGFGILPTWPTLSTAGQIPVPIPGWASLLFSVPIDHCLTSSSIQVINVRTSSDIGSDHRALIVDLQV